MKSMPEVLNNLVDSRILSVECEEGSMKGGIERIKITTTDGDEVTLIADGLYCGGGYDICYITVVGPTG